MTHNPEEAFGGTRPLLALIESIYESVENPARWNSVLEDISDAIRGGPVFMAGGPVDAALMVGVRVDPDAIDEYLRYYAGVNVMSSRCDRVFADGTVRYGDRVIADPELERTEFYNDFFARYDMYYSCGIKVPLEGLSPIYLSCQRPHVRGPFTESEGIVLETLLPHLKRALGLYVQLTQSQANQRGMEAALDAFDHAVFGLNGTGRVVFQNAGAEELVRKGDAVQLRHGKLDAACVEQSGALRRLVANAVATGSADGQIAGGSMLLASRSGGQELSVTVTPFASSTPYGTKRLAAMVFVNDPNGAKPQRGALLRTLYGLTPAEVRTADLLLQGLEVREIADRLRFTTETARYHVKKVMAKTGTHRQSELMRLMLSLPSVAFGA